MTKSDQALELKDASLREAKLAKGRQVLNSTREEFFAKAKAAKAKLGNVDGVLAGSVKRDLPTGDKVN